MLHRYMAKLKLYVPFFRIQLQLLYIQHISFKLSIDDYHIFYAQCHKSLALDRVKYLGDSHSFVVCLAANM